jgi:hypothetical protein
MKTVKQHLEALEDPQIRSAALKNMFRDYAEEWSESQHKALARAFIWNRSEEGYTYWNNIHAAMIGNDPLPANNKA